MTDPLWFLRSGAMFGILAYYSLLIPAFYFTFLADFLKLSNHWPLLDRDVNVNASDREPLARGRSRAATQPIATRDRGASHPGFTVYGSTYSGDSSVSTSAAGSSFGSPSTSVSSIHAPPSGVAGPRPYVPYASGAGTTYTYYTAAPATSASVFPGSANSTSYGPGPVTSSTLSGFYASPGHMHGHHVSYSRSRPLSSTGAPLSSAVTANDREPSGSPGTSTQR